MMVAILAVLEAGAAYLPIDPSLPEKRIRYMLADSGAHLALTDTKEGKERLHRRILTFADCRLHAQNISPLEKNAARADDPAYIIYTSGSTGKPKGVVVEHRHLLANAAAFAKEFRLGIHDRALQQAAFTFDVFCEEVFPTLFRGAGLVLAQEDWLKDFGLLVEGIERHGVNVIDCTPLMLGELNRTGPPACLHTFINGGDTLKKSHIDGLLKQGIVYNTYGPTETTICATYYRCDGEEASGIPIGSPIANYTVSILDRHGNVLPVGIPGEMCVAGAGVSRGYLNRPELTAETFAEGLYRTGDRGRWLEDGTIEFLGRMDRQVKIRGYRIELGEIEALLATHESVDDAAVTTWEDENLGISLCAYLAVGTHEPDNLTPAMLREFLGGQLPHYMIPAYFVVMESLPLTSHGKLDARALPSPQQNLRTGARFEAPVDDIQTQLYGIWRQVLGIEAFSIHDNIFDLGGNSLLLLQLHRGIDGIFPEVVNVVDLFANPTIAGLGTLIRQRLSGDDGLLELPLINLPEDWFAAEGDRQEESAIDFFIDGEILEGLLRLAAVTGVALERILLSLFIYLFNEAGDNGRVGLVAAIGEPGQLQEVSVDLESLDSIDALFARVDDVVTGDSGLQFESTDMNRISLRRERGQAPALFCGAAQIQWSADWAGVFDIVFQPECLTDRIEFICRCSQRLTPQSAEKLAETYMKLLDVVSRH